MADNSSLFNRLTKLFRSGPIVKRRVKNVSSHLLRHLLLRCLNALIATSIIIR